MPARGAPLEGGGGGVPCKRPCIEVSPSSTNAFLGSGGEEEGKGSGRGDEGCGTPVEALLALCVSGRIRIAPSRVIEVEEGSVVSDELVLREEEEEEEEGPTRWVASFRSFKGLSTWLFFLSFTVFSTVPDSTSGVSGIEMDAFRVFDSDVLEKSLWMVAVGTAPFSVSRRRG